MNGNPITFKLLAVRPLKGCKDYILKCLHEDVTYYLCNDFSIKINDKRKYIVSRNVHSMSAPVSDNFFSLDSYSDDNPQKDSIKINISAVVAKNGNGKSALLELVIRLLNNFIASHNFYADNDSIISIDGVRAALFYQFGESIYMLSTVNTSNVPKLYKIAYIIGEDIHNNYTSIEDTNVAKQFFYTLVTNYSHYAYNAHDYVKEVKSKNQDKEDNYWIFHVFHKNDGYQAPLSLQPFRSWGNIDINSEYNLSIQRLLSLFVSASDPNKDPNSFRILNKKIAKFVTLDDIGYSKFQERTIVDYLKENRDKNELVDNRIVRGGKLVNGPFSVNKNAIEHLGLFLSIIEHQDFNSEQKCDNVLQQAITWLKSRDDWGNIKSTDSDIRHIVNMLDGIRPYENGADVGNIHVYREELRKYQDLNLKQLLRINLALRVSNAWNEKYKVITKDHEAGIKADVLFKNYDELSLVDKCQHYILYKIISTFSRYPDYQDLQNVYQNVGSDIFQNHEAITYVRNSLQKFMDIDFSLLESDIQERSHITLKLRQTIKYLDQLRSHNTPIFEDLSIRIRRKKNPPFDVDIDMLSKKYSKELEDLENMPPAIYKWDILFYYERQNHLIPYNLFSSGEKQKLNSLGMILYHIRNIDSVNDRNGQDAKYEAVNLFFDEIELYYHPEWQREYIYTIMRAIRGLQLKSIKAINMTFATHSPFILSDIPKNNVLFLKDGMPDYSMQENTFGANINSLLKNGFFMPTLPIGAFAHEKINELFRRLNSGMLKHVEDEDMYNDILQVGEPYLRGKLLKLYQEYKLVQSDSDLKEFIEQIVEQKVSEKLKDRKQ